MGETIIRIVTLPKGMNGFVTEDTNGDYNVYINALLTHEKQQETIAHEMAHIKRDDFRNNLPIKIVEEML